jgi:hypothetical protein
MSAFLCSSDTLSALATYWHENVTRDQCSDPVNDITRAIYHGSPGMPWGDATIQAQQLTKGRLPALVVYELLLSENQASLEARYPGDLEYRSAEGYCFSPDPHVVHCVNRYGLGDRSRFKTGWIVSLLDGYEYQSCEHRSWRTSIGQALCHQIRRMLTHDLERLQTDRKTQHWASYDRSCWDAAATGEDS